MRLKIRLLFLGIALAALSNFLNLNDIRMMVKAKDAFSTAMSDPNSGRHNLHKRHISDDKEITEKVFGITDFRNSDFGVKGFDTTGFVGRGFGNTDFGGTGFGNTNYGTSDFGNTDFGNTDFGTTDFANTD